MFDQQVAVEQYSDRRAAEAAAAERAAAEEKDKRRVLNLFKQGIAPEEIAKGMELDLSLVKEWLSVPTMA